MGVDIPPQHVLNAFLSAGNPKPLSGGEGRSFLDDSIILKPVDDASEAEYVSKIQHTLATKSPSPCYRLAEPIKASVTDANEYVVDGWTATRYIPGRDSQSYSKLPWDLILRASRAFHTDLANMAHEPPPFIAKRDHKWAKGDRVAWEEEIVEEGDIVSVFQHAFSRLLELRGPLSMLSGATKPQLIHGDLAGNMLFSEVDPTGQPPAIIDLTLYWRPVEFAEAILVADGLLWYGEGEDLIFMVGTDELRLQMLVRALIFRLIASSEAVRERVGEIDEAALEESKGFMRASNLVSQILQSKSSSQ